MTRPRFTVHGKWGRHAAAEFELIEDLEDMDGDHGRNVEDLRENPPAAPDYDRRPGPRADQRMG